MARKPLTGTVAGNVLEYGTGALNIDGCRVEGVPPSVPQPKFSNGRDDLPGHSDGRNGEMSAASGRWPANVALDGDAAAMLDRQSGNRPGAVSNGSKTTDGMQGTATFRIHEREQEPGRADQGGASRFFYTAKANRQDRGEGNTHPTVKPVSLMRWLVRMVTPPGGLVLDPFAGSGTTAEATIIEGFRSVLIEQHEPYLPIIEARLKRPMQPDMFGGAA